MDEPREEAVEEPTRTEEDAEEAASWMAQGWTSLAAVSIGVTLLVALLLLQATGLLDLLGEGVGREPLHWMGFVAVVLVVTAAFAWGRRAP